MPQRTAMSLNRLTQIAATLCGTPGATVVLGGESSMQLRGGTNVCVDQAPKAGSFTEIAIQQGPGSVLVVEDASKDPRFADHPLVAGPSHVRFYAGAVITLKSGQAVGALCALDVVARRRPDDATLAALETLADLVADIMDRDTEFRRQRDELAMIDLAEAMSGVGHWRMDITTRAVSWSDAVYRIHGVTPDDYQPTHDTVASFYHPDDQDRFTAEIRQVIQTGEEGQAEFRLVLRNGEERLVLSRAAVERGPDGQLMAVFGVVQDITQERNILKRVSTSEARYRLLADNMADVVTRMQRDGTSTYISPAVQKLLGWTSDEMTGQAVDYIHPEDCAKVMGVIASVLDGSDRTSLMHRVRHRDGHYVWVESRFQRIQTEEGRAPEAIVVIRDVSRRKALEEQLKTALDESREQGARYRLLADRAQDVIVTYGYDMKVRYVSPVVEEITGLKPEEVVGRPVISLIHPEDAPGAVENLSNFLRENPKATLFSQKYRALNKDGEVRHYETRTRIVHDEHGRVAEIQDVVRDVTETHRLEGELREALVQAEAAGNAKSEFLANMSHELRTPLTSVVGFASLLKTSSSLRAEDRRHVERIATGSEALLSVINDILDYSKLEADALEMDPHPFDLQDFAEGAAELMEGQREAKGLELDLNIAPQVPAVLVGDEGRLRQVTLNFLSNAMKFTARGTVTLDVGGSPSPDGGWRLRVAVTDTGIGVEANKLDTLFERFTQADQSTTRNFGGTGLGLAISKRLIELMGGEIGAESRLNQGSTFWFEVPLQVAEETEASLQAPTAMPERHARILIADDAAANRELVSAILTQLGAEPTLAGNGVEALAAVQTSSFDLVLMDMHMPEMDGLEATRRIRALGGAFAHLPIVALTANVQAEQIRRCLDSGMDDHVGKPINIAELAATVAHWLEPGNRDGTRLQKAVS